MAKETLWLHLEELLTQELWSQYLLAFYWLSRVSLWWMDPVGCWSQLYTSPLNPVFTDVILVD
jgi:hypothetical protein